MDRINNTGKMIIDYKKELMKHYSPLVDESLKTSLNVLQDKKILDEETIDSIINDSISLREFETFVMGKRDYLKSMKELAEEFEKVRLIVNNSLTKIGFTNFVDTECNIDNDTITILRQYSINEEFIKLYFGLADEDMENIMKRRGFAEKFAVLRLAKIFKEILSEMRVETEYSQGFSKVYYNEVIKGFTVDYRYHINVNSITEESIDAKIKKIRDADRVVERKFSKKSGIGFYNIKPLEQSKEPLKVVPKNKNTEAEISPDELNEIQNQLISDHQENEPIQEVQATPITAPNVVNSPVEQPKIEDKGNIPKVENIDELSPFKEEPKLMLEIQDDTESTSETAEYIEDVSNNKIEIDETDDFGLGLIPPEVLAGGLDLGDGPSDNDFDMEEPDDDTIDFA